VKHAVATSILWIAGTLVGCSSNNTADDAGSPSGSGSSSGTASSSGAVGGSSGSSGGTGSSSSGGSGGSSGSSSGSPTPEVDAGVPPTGDDGGAGTGGGEAGIGSGEGGATASCTWGRPPSTTGDGLMRHDFVYCGEWFMHGAAPQTIYVIRGGKITPVYSIPGAEELDDCTMLCNGNIVFSRKQRGASEVDPTGKIVWDHPIPAGYECHTAQPIDQDRVLLMLNGAMPHLEIVNTKTNMTEKSLPLPIAPGSQGNPHGQFRHIRMTGSGTFLVSHMNMSEVIEYDMTGKEIWRTAPGIALSVWAAVRLPNGNTLISGNGNGFLREVDKTGMNIVWQVNKTDLPGITFNTVQEAERLSNGNTVINNWSPAYVPGDVQVVEVTPAKQVVWTLKQSSMPDFGPGSSTQILDEIGIPEHPGDQLR
jgi:hypothetical protein